MRANPASSSAALAAAVSPPPTPTLASRRRSRRTFVGLCAALLLGAACPRVEAATYFVTFDDDSGDYSTGRVQVAGSSGDLRYCLIQANANPGSTIFFNAANGTHRLNQGLPPITAAMTISDQYGGITTIDAQGNGRIFFVDAPGATVNFIGLRLINGRAKGGDSIYGDGAGGGGGAGLGGAVFVNEGNAKFQGCQFAGNMAVGGDGSSGRIVQPGGSGGGGLGGCRHLFPRRRRRLPRQWRRGPVSR